MRVSCRCYFSHIRSIIQGIFGLHKNGYGDGSPWGPSTNRASIKFCVNDFVIIRTISPDVAMHHAIGRPVSESGQLY